MEAVKAYEALVAIDAVKAYDELITLEAVAAYDALKDELAYDALNIELNPYGPNTLDAVTNEAVNALLAQLAVPNNEPVIDGAFKLPDIV